MNLKALLEEPKSRKNLLGRQPFYHSISCDPKQDVYFLSHDRKKEPVHAG